MKTKAEQEHLDRVISLGCIACRNLGMLPMPAEIHHLKRNPETGQHLGMGQRASHFHVIPLCHEHHRSGRMGIAYHAGPRSWEFKYGTEIELWEQVGRLLEVAW